jgi:hypothetical protein
VYESNPDLKPTIDDYRDREPEVFATVDETLREVATTDDPQARQSPVDSLVTDPDAALPPTHTSGAGWSKRSRRSRAERVRWPS